MLTETRKTEEKVGLRQNYSMIYTLQSTKTIKVYLVSEWRFAQGKHISTSCAFFKHNLDKHPRRTNTKVIHHNLNDVDYVGDETIH